MRSTFKVLFYVKKGSAKPNGNLPLMCRLTVDGEIKQFSCKMEVPPHLWDVKNNRASGKSAEAQRINRAVDKIRVEVNRRYQELMQTDGYVTAAKLKDAYLGIGIKQETLLKLFEQHNAEFAKKVGHSRAKGTFQRYITVCKHIREFLPHTYKREDDLEGGPGTFLLFNEFGQCVLLMCSVSLSLIGMSISITDRDSR